MYHLTATQYGILRTTAHNLCVSSNDKNLEQADTFMGLLADEIAILTGELPEESVCHKAFRLAKELDKSSQGFDARMESADRILEVFIGPFTADEWQPSPEDLSIINDSTHP